MSAAQHSPTSGQGGRALARFRAAFTVLRDVTMTSLALYGIWHQESSGRVNPWLLLTYVVILGLIPATHALALTRWSLSSPAVGPGEPTPAQPSLPPA